MNSTPRSPTTTVSKTTILRHRHILLGAHLSESKHECFLLRDLVMEEKIALQLQTIPTRFCHRELFKLEVDGLEMLDRFAAIGYRVEWPARAMAFQFPSLVPMRFGGPLFEICNNCWRCWWPRFKIDKHGMDIILAYCLISHNSQFE